MNPFTRLRFLAPALLLTVATTGCVPEEEAHDVERGSTDKADLIGGSCEDSCGDISSDGICWCDEQCADFGDCCADIAEFCPDVAPSCIGLDLVECGERSDCRLESGPGGSIFCTDVSSLPSCIGLDLVECGERSDCRLESGPGGSIFCTDVSSLPSCIGLDLVECGERSDCRLESGPGGSIFCTDA